MSEILDLRQSSRTIAAYNERMACRYDDEPELIESDRRHQHSLADRGSGWLAELLHLAADSAPTRSITTLELQLTTTALTVSFSIADGFIERLLQRINSPAPPAPGASLALLLQVGRPQFHTTQGSVVFTPMPPPDASPSWLVEKKFGPISFARPIDGLASVTPTGDRGDVAKLLLSMTSADADDVAAEVHNFDLQYLGFIDGDVDLTIIDDTRNQTTRIRKHRDADGRNWVGRADEREYPLTVHRSENRQLIWSVLERPGIGGRLCSYLPTATTTTIPGLLHVPWQPDDADTITRSLDHELHLVGLAALVRKVANTRHGKRLLAELDVTDPADTWADRLLRQHVGPIQQTDVLQPIFDKMRSRAGGAER